MNSRTVVLMLAVTLAACGNKDSRLSESPPAGKVAEVEHKPQPAQPEACAKSATPTPALDPTRDGYCKLTISGAITDEREYLGTAMGRGPFTAWWQTADNIDEEIGAAMVPSMFVLNCADDDDRFLGLRTPQTAKSKDFTFGPSSYRIVSQKAKPGELKMVFTFSSVPYEITGKELTLSRFDLKGIDGVFVLSATSEDAPVTVKGEFAYGCVHGHNCQ